MTPKNPHVPLLSFSFMHSSRTLKWTAMLTPFLPPASWNFTCKEQNHLLRVLNIASKSLASKGYLPLQLQDILTSVSEHKNIQTAIMSASQNFNLYVDHVQPVKPYVVTNIL